MRSNVTCMSHCLDTVLPADSVEFCPSPGSSHIFAVGTYKLEEGNANAGDQLEAPQRRGKCLLFEVDVAKSDNDDTIDCRQLQELPMPGILDMKWSSDGLAIADADGSIGLYRLVGGRLELLENSCVNPKSLCLSLDWAKNRSAISSDILATSCSDGSIVVVKRAQSSLVVTDNWIGHEFESWITAWDRWDQNKIYTGGDDCKLKGWDCRAGYETPIFSNARFDGGVTSVQSSPHAEHMLAVGSYDAHVRIFDTRQTSKPVAQVAVGGGAWRVKWHYDPGKKDYLLVACMHDGCKIIKFDGSEMSQGAVSFRFDKHESLVYGADWAHTFLSKQESLVGSCSFYDRQLRLYRVQHDVCQ